MIDKHVFGITGHMSTRVLFGAAALSGTSRQEAEETLGVLMQYGVNHIDVAASYGNGEAEEKVGEWMETHRGRFFLATKTGKRTYSEAKDEFRSSLERLRVENVDLIQLHNLTEPEEWDTAMGDGGALEALMEAREQGLTRFIGVTGHGVKAPEMHLRSVERFDFASVLLPLNFPMMQNQEYAQAVRRLLEVCRERTIAVQTIKSVARGPWGDKEHTRTTWYETLESQPDLVRAVGWVLGHPGVFLNTAGDVRLLPRVLQAADGAGWPSDDEMRQMVTRLGMQPLFS